LHLLNIIRLYDDKDGMSKIKRTIFVTLLTIFSVACSQAPSGGSDDSDVLFRMWISEFNQDFDLSEGSFGDVFTAYAIDICDYQIKFEGDNSSGTYEIFSGVPNGSSTSTTCNTPETGTYTITKDDYSDEMRFCFGSSCTVFYYYN
jgi:hypothetical protein